MEKKGYQKLTEEEEKIWIPNRNLQLTQKAEIVRLNKVIEEKKRRNFQIQEIRRGTI